MSDSLGSSDSAPTYSDHALGRSVEIGPYKLLQPLGAGGIGEVWLAEQLRPVRRQVALKVIKAGMDTAQVVARFEAERQALAMMDHPNIAKVFDAGSTPAGRPFFVMEFARGEPITGYCDRVKAGVRERLHLFLQVCDAVQHAHQKGIIHRDLKPSNILITLRDGEASPKIIDFGVAKATSHRLTDRTLVTEIGGLVGTPEYMSPEQAGNNPFDVDTRTDVYGLGVVLYELLTGSLPFDSATLRESGVDELRRMIREVDPPRPSVRLSRLGAAAGEIAKQRAADRTSLGNQITGDLDWITFKALAKERSARYSSAADLAADIRRHLTNRPVVARPPSVLYRARKFGTRHTTAVLVATIVIVLSVAAGVSYVLQAREVARARVRAALEADAATQVADFVVGLFQVSSPGTARGNSVTAREILDAGVEKVAALNDQPALQGRLMRVMGEVYESLGLYERSETLLRQALAIQERTLTVSPEEPLISQTELAYVLSRQGQNVEAEALLLAAVEGLTRLSGPTSDVTTKARSNLAFVYKRQGKLVEAERQYLDLTAAAERSRGRHHFATLADLNNLATVYTDLKKYDEAIRLHTEILTVRQRDLGSDHPLVASSLNNLASALQQAGRFEEARGRLQQAIQIANKVLGPSHPTYGLYVHTLGEVFLSEGRLVDAERELTLAAKTYDRQPAHEYSGLVRFQLAQVAARQGDQGRAVTLLRQALAAGYPVARVARALEDDSAFSTIRQSSGVVALSKELRAELKPKKQL